MKIHPSTRPVPLLVAAGLLFASLPSPAQSAEGFDTSDLAPVEPAAKSPAKAAPEPAPAPAIAEIVPSRYAGEEIAGYVGTLSAGFSIRERVTDPFGRYQDPDFKAPEPKILNKTPNQRTFKAEPPTPFADIVAAITVKLVIPAKQQFLMEDRVFKVGNIFSLRLPNGKQVKVQVMAVSSARINFRNVETGESAVLNLDLRPSNMQKGTGDLNVPGVQPSGNDVPIEIQPALPLSNNR